MLDKNKKEYVQVVQKFAHIRSYVKHFTIVVGNSQ